MYKALAPTYLAKNLIPLFLQLLRYLTSFLKLFVSDNTRNCFDVRDSYMMTNTKFFIKLLPQRSLLLPSNNVIRQ